MIPATMVDTLDSAKTFPGERYRFKTTAASIVRGVRIPAGTTGWGIVSFSAAASNRAQWRDRARTSVPDHRIEDRPSRCGPARGADPIARSDRRREGAGYIPIIGLVKSAVNTVRNGTNITVGAGFAFHLIAVGDPTDVSPRAVRK